MSYFDDDTVIEFKDEMVESEASELDMAEESDFNVSGFDAVSKPKDTADVKTKRKKMYIGSGLAILLFIVIVGILVVTGRAYISTNNTSKVTTQSVVQTTAAKQSNSVQTTQVSSKVVNTNTQPNTSTKVGVARLDDRVVGAEQQINVVIKDIRLMKDDVNLVTQYLLVLGYTVGGKDYTIGYYVSESSASRLHVGQSATMTYKLTEDNKIPVISGLKIGN